MSTGIRYAAEESAAGCWGSASRHTTDVCAGDASNAHSFSPGVPCIPHAAFQRCHFVFQVSVQHAQEATDGSCLPSRRVDQTSSCCFFSGNGEEQKGTGRGKTGDMAIARDEGAGGDRPNCSLRIKRGELGSAAQSAVRSSLLR